ncbi:unnamed protein product [Trichobilharzia szidati]|nr:unnamed protein product [Trichobilharzia szidati]
MDINYGTKTKAAFSVSVAQHIKMSRADVGEWLALHESVVKIKSGLDPKSELEESDEKPFTRAEISYINKLLNSNLFETREADFELLRSDPNHPLHSARTFQELNLKDPLLKGISQLGFYRPSTIQERALGSLISDNPQNMIAQSQSGTGKTATFLLAMLSRVNADVPYCQCLCMAPTRELALQIDSVGQKMAQFMSGVSFATAVRSPRANINSDGFVSDQIVIGTPGTIANWFRGTGQYRIDPTKVVMFVLDEADIMIEEEGFLNICMRVKTKLPRNCQILLFSATYEDSVIEFAHDFVPNPIEFRIKRSQLPLKNIKQFYICFNDWIEKYQALKDIYGGFAVGQAIIFCALINAKTSDKRPTDEEKLKPSTSNTHNAGCGSELKKASLLLTGKASFPSTNSTTHHQTSRNPYTLMQKDALDREFFAKLIEAKCNEYETSRRMKKHHEYKGGEIKSRGKHRSFEDYACRPSTSLHYQPIPSTSFDKENKEIRGSISDECFHKLHSNQRGDKSTETPTIRQISPPQHPIWDTPADLRTSSNYFFRP